MRALRDRAALERQMIVERGPDLQNRGKRLGRAHDRRDLIGRRNAAVDRIDQCLKLELKAGLGQRGIRELPRTDLRNDVASLGHAEAKPLAPAVEIELERRKGV